MTRALAGLLLLLLPASAVRAPEEDLLLDVDAQASSLADSTKDSSDLTANASGLMQRAVGDETTMSCHSFCIPCTDGTVVYLGRAKHPLKKILDAAMVSLSIITWPLIFASAGYLAAEKAFADKLIPVCPNLQIIQFPVDGEPEEFRPDDLLKGDSPLKVFTKDIEAMYLHQKRTEEEEARLEVERATGDKAKGESWLTKAKRFAVSERSAGQLPLLWLAELDEQPFFCGKHGNVTRVDEEAKVIEEGNLGSLGNAVSDTFW
eukprot:CAMPEP_0171094926 /NCGR_PEP_ID=MMETSP0766_2-20121228/42884_1 /TAXON_ID=439317 /ORGANISM="Gambierdiscus australes, Strain CAWD 149" /LENGTH=261 /DNA_ID=CAMNT_0011553673 /DNA_START=64 /DNA_END=846 /DNA_ORIENTATION=+